MKQRGFSIVEIMVGLVIGLLGTIVIFQVFAASEGYKRTTTSGGDSQQNGSVALLTIERDARIAGSGLSADILQNCTVYHTYIDPDGNGSSPGGAIPNFSLAAATILNANGQSGSDTIVLRWGTSIRNNVASEITSTMPQSSSELKLNSVYGYAEDDLVMVSNGTDCTLMQVTEVQTGSLHLQHNPENTPPVYNPDVPYQNGPPAPEAPWPAYTAGASVFNFGNMVIRTYSVSGNALQAQEPTIAATPLVADIVNIQAQYGIAPAGSNDVNCWVNATNGGNACDGGNWASPTAADQKRIKAIRLAVVSRSALPERPSIAGGACDTTTAAPTTWTGGPAVDLSADATWQCYRYKVLQTIVPLRNVLWADI